MHARILALSAAVLIGGCATAQRPPTLLSEYGIPANEITEADIMANQVFGPSYAAALHIAADTMLVSNALGWTPQQVERTGMPGDITAGDWRTLQTVAWRVQHGLPPDMPGVNLDLHPGKRTDAGVSGSMKVASWRFPFGVEGVNDAGRKGPVPAFLRMFQTVFPLLKT